MIIIKIILLVILVISIITFIIMGEAFIKGHYNDTLKKFLIFYLVLITIFLLCIGIRFIIFHL